uniref:Fibrinogen C-terminal domain-containing protein n=1 Tax=Terrapene triunguis TaxID=2587831 RepID=A0A674IAC3_9SAUR
MQLLFLGGGVGKEAKERFYGNSTVIVTLSGVLFHEVLFLKTCLVLPTAWPKDCSEITWNRVSGVFVIQPTGLHQFEVYCELNSTSEGWTVLQRNRHDTQITWAESWSTYKYGFGNVQDDYWLGTEYIYQIAKQKVYQIRFVIHDSSGTMKYADYNLFGLEEESKGYRLRLGSYTGTAGDAMTSNNPTTVHDNMKFSAKDLDQDIYGGNCASSYGGGWWYSACHSVRLNVKGSITWGSFCMSFALRLMCSSRGHGWGNPETQKGF